MKPHYLDQDWRYHTAASHANSAAFARRQQQRRRDAQEAARAATAKVAPIKRAAK